MSNSQTNSAAPVSNTIPRQAYILLVVGILAVSLAAIFIRYALDEGVPSVVVAAARLVIAALILTPFALLRHRDALRRLTRSDWLFAAASSFMLALHFAAWVSSLEGSSVLISVTLVTTGSLWVALLEFIFLKVRLPRAVFIGLGIALFGGMMIGLSGAEDTTLGSNPLRDGLLALTGAITFAVYIIIGRKLRSQLPLLPYLWVVYGGAAIILSVVIVLTQTPVTGYSSQAYMWIVLLALVPQLIGHSSFNYVVRHLPATFVSVASQAEPIGSAVAAYFLFQQEPTILQIIGSVVILGGVLLASLGQSRSS